MLQMKEELYLISKEELKALWLKSWLLSKGLDKTEALEVDYREKSFEDYLSQNIQSLPQTQIPEQPVTVTLPHIIYGDPVESAKVIPFKKENDNDDKTE